MKIAIIVNELNVRGGTHKQVLRLCQYLEKIDIDYVLCTKYYEPENTYEEFQKIDVRYLKKGINQRRPAGFNLYRRIENYFASRKEDIALYNLIPEDIDVVNVHDCFLEGFMKIAIKAGKKVVWQINDLHPAFLVGNSKSQKDSLTKKRFRYRIKKVAQKVDVITVNVSKNANRVKKILGRDAVVLYCGVDKNDKLEIHQHCSKTTEFRLLTMGVFFPYRNYETLVIAIKKLQDKGKNIRLDIIGNTNLDYSYSEKIRNMIVEYQLEEHVKIWGQVDDDIYSKLFNLADIFAFVNIDQSWGLAVFEAMSCGLPTIVSNSVGAVELLHNEEDSVFVEPTDIEQICGVIERFMDDSVYYNKISNAAAEVVKEYTWDALYCSKIVEIMKLL